MRVVKPSRLSLLTRPYRWQGVDLLGTAVLAMATLDDVPGLMTEQALWRLASQETGGVVDLGVPKACAEFLVSGMAYTRHQPQKTACALRVRVGELDKSLLVFGDRYWLDDRPTAPAPFDAMRVDWRHAHGGPECPDNPSGLGMLPCRVNGVEAVPLPNVEAPDRRISRPGQAPQPAGFDGIPPDNPARFARMGTQYGQQWVEREFPGFAPDMDWRYFNAAPADQWWHDRPAVPAGADYEIHNMHPERPVQRGRLPDWRVRCFANRRGAGLSLEEIPLRMTTAWFFPHHDRVLLIWHGMLQVRESDAADIAHMMPAIELPGASRDIDHYRDVLRRRTDPRDGAVHALRDSDLVAPALYAAAPDPPLPDVEARPLARNLRAGAARRRESYRELLAAEGLDPDEYLPPPDPPAPRPSIDNLPAMFGQAEQERRKGEALLARGRQAMLDDPDLRRFGEATGIDIDAVSRPDGGGTAGSRLDPRAVMRQLREFDEQFAVPTPSDEGANAQAPHRPLTERLGPGVGQLYLHTAHTGAAPQAMSPHRAQRIRRRVAAIYQRDRDFTGIQLIGADLSGMDLRGSCFRDASLEAAKLDGARLDDCDFGGAVLARASMRGGSLARARLAHANVAAVEFERVALSGASLEQAMLENARFRSCSFAGASLARARLQESRFTDCDFGGATLEELAPMKSRFERCRFDEAALRRCAFMECALAAVAFPRAQLTRCAFVNTAFDPEIDFTGARFEMSSFSSGTVLRAACLDGAELRQCGLRGVCLEGASLVRAVLRGSDLSECAFKDARMDGVDGMESLFVRADFTGASLRRANLMHGLMGGADFTRTDLREANLFRADLAEAVLDGTAALGGAYTDGAKLWPRRRAPAADGAE